MNAYVAHVTVNRGPECREAIKDMPGLTTVVALHICGSVGRGFTEVWLGIDAETREEAYVEAWRLAEAWRVGLDATKADVNLIDDGAPVTANSGR